jgi:hypothetical protein
VFGKQAVAIDITCTGDWESTMITHWLATDNKTTCASSNGW